MPSTTASPRGAGSTRLPGIHGDRHATGPPAHCLSYIEKSPRYSIRVRPKDIEDERVHMPGPGGYDQTGDDATSKFDQGGKYVFATSERVKRTAIEKQRDLAPGPGAYITLTPAAIVSPKPPGCSFGKGVRPVMAGPPAQTPNMEKNTTRRWQEKSVPGPGKYDRESSFGGALSYTMQPARRNKLSSKEDIPGPGSYGGQYTMFGGL